MDGTNPSWLDTELARCSSKRRLESGDGPLSIVVFIRSRHLHALQDENVGAPRPGGKIVLAVGRRRKSRVSKKNGVPDFTINLSDCSKSNDN